jgi:hypothetical protein
MKKLFILAITVIFACLSTAHAEVSEAKRVEIEKMLRLTGTEKLMSQMITQMLSGFRAQNSSVPPEFWTKMEKEMDPHDLLDQIIPLYDKYYSLEDMKAANAFYESPAGQRILKAMPDLMQESMKIGQKWGMEKAQHITEELKKQP